MKTTLDMAPGGHDLGPLREISAPTTDIGALALGKEGVISDLPDLSHMSLGALFDPQNEARLSELMSKLVKPERPSIGGHNS